VTEELHPLVTEALRKAAVAWLDVPGSGQSAVWMLWHDDAAYVVHGPGEQPAPGLGSVDRCRLVVRSADTLARILAVDATVTAVEPGGANWDEVAPQLAAKRLNAPDGGRTVERWAKTCTVSRLVPDPEPAEAGPTLPTDSLAAPPPPTPATSRTPIPFTVGSATKKRPGGRRAQRR
jgi:hypothetical protein